MLGSLPSIFAMLHFLSILLELQIYRDRKYDWERYKNNTVQFVKTHEPELDIQRKGWYIPSSLFTGWSSRLAATAAMAATTSISLEEHFHFGNNLIRTETAVAATGTTIPGWTGSAGCRGRVWLWQRRSCRWRWRCGRTTFIVIHGNQFVLQLGTLDFVQTETFTNYRQYLSRFVL